MVKSEWKEGVWGISNMEDGVLYVFAYEPATYIVQLSELLDLGLFCGICNRQWYNGPDLFYCRSWRKLYECRVKR